MEEVIKSEKFNLYINLSEKYYFSGKNLKKIGKKAFF